MESVFIGTRVSMLRVAAIGAKSVISAGDIVAQNIPATFLLQPTLAE